MKRLKSSRCSEGQRSKFSAKNLQLWECDSKKLAQIHLQLNYIHSNCIIYRLYIYIAHINKYISRYNVIYIFIILKKRKDSIKKLQEPTEDLNEGVWSSSAPETSLTFTNRRLQWSAENINWPFFPHYRFRRVPHSFSSCRASREPEKADLRNRSV